MLFLIAQIRSFGTLNATQKTAALYKAPFLKNKEKKFQKWDVFNKKNAFLAIFRLFFRGFFKNGALQRAGFFCVTFSVTA